MRHFIFQIVTKMFWKMRGESQGGKPELQPRPEDSGFPTWFSGLDPKIPAFRPRLSPRENEINFRFCSVFYFDPNSILFQFLFGSIFYFVPVSILFSFLKTFLKNLEEPESLNLF